MSDRHKQNYFSGGADDSWINQMYKNTVQKVELLPCFLTELVRRSGIQSFGLLSLDVEGHELEVLKSYDWHVPIKYILVESNANTPKVKELLESLGFKFLEIIAHNVLFMKDI